MNFPMEKIKTKELRHVINKNLSLRKAPAWDLITGNILKELPANIFRTITALFNAPLRLSTFQLNGR